MASRRGSAVRGDDVTAAVAGQQASLGDLAAAPRPAEPDRPRAHRRAADLCAGGGRSLRLAITAEGELNTVAYGGMLRAKRPIMVRGAGRQFSGTYYVERVHHIFTPESYTQRFTLRRNAVGLAGSRVVRGQPWRCRHEERVVSAEPQSDDLRRAAVRALLRQVPRRWSPTTRTQRTWAASRRACRRCSATWSTGWALPALPYAGDGVGVYTVPAPDAGVWIEFEAGDVSRPIWSGCWWGDGQLPKDESGAGTTPRRKILRTEEGLLLALDDGGKTIALSDANGNNLLKIEVQPGQITVQAGTKVVVEAPQIELVEGATHPLVFGDNLLTYLNQLVSMFNAHMHPGELALGILPVTPAPPVPIFPPATPSLLSMKVKTRLGGRDGDRAICRARSRTSTTAWRRRSRTRLPA